MNNTLVVFYSRSGYTRRVAQSLARALDADLEEITDLRSRAGVLGYLRSATEALTRKCPNIGPARNDPAAYELVVIGTPVWAGRVSSPVRTYLVRHAATLPRVSLFCTYGGSGADKVLAEMAALSGHAPVSTLAVTDREIAHADDKPLRFAEALRARRHTAVAA